MTDPSKLSPRQQPVRVTTACCLLVVLLGLRIPAPGGASQVHRPVFHVDRAGLPSRRLRASLRSARRRHVLDDVSAGDKHPRLRPGWLTRARQHELSSSRSLHRPPGLPRSFGYCLRHASLPVTIFNPQLFRAPAAPVLSDHLGVAWASPSQPPALDSREPHRLLAAAIQWMVTSFSHRLHLESCGPLRPARGPLGRCPSLKGHLVGAGCRHRSPRRLDDSGHVCPGFRIRLPVLRQASEALAPTALWSRTRRHRRVSSALSACSDASRFQVVSSRGAHSSSRVRGVSRAPASSGAAEFKALLH